METRRSAPRQPPGRPTCSHPMATILRHRHIARLTLLRTLTPHHSMPHS